MNLGHVEGRSLHCFAIALSRAPCSGITAIPYKHLCHLKPPGLLPLTLTAPRAQDHVSLDVNGPGRPSRDRYHLEREGTGVPSLSTYDQQPPALQHQRTARRSQKSTASTAKITPSAWFARPLDFIGSYSGSGAPGEDESAEKASWESLTLTTRISRLGFRVRTALQALRSNTYIILVALFIMGVVAVGGCLAVRHVAQTYETSVASGIVQIIQTEITVAYIGVRSIMPGLTIAVAANPENPSIEDSFQRMSKATVDSAESGIAIRTARNFGPVNSVPFLEKVQEVRDHPMTVGLFMAPMGIISNVYQRPNAGVEIPFAIGQNIFDDPISAYTINYALQLWSYLARRPQVINGTNTLTFFYPVYVPDTLPNTSFGYPELINCTLCYNAARKEKFWGVMGVTLHLPHLVHASAAFAKYTRRGVKYVNVVRTDQSVFPQDDPIYPAYNDPALLKHGTWASASSTGFRTFTSYVQIPDRMKAVWRDPLYVACVLIGAILGAFYTSMAVARVEFLILLRSMLPSVAIQGLLRNANIAETFPQVTVLFLDICGYTSMSNKFSALEMVRMLDELYTSYDSILLMHPDVYKVDTIGDAFMVSSNCPTRGDARAAAVALTRFAMDVIKGTKAWKSSKGHSVEIRVGAHTGPTVAAVLGFLKPKFSLFGSTVNIASRMESTSVPGHFQVTTTTAELLRGTEFYLEEREVHVKGVGAMKTYLVHASKPTDITPGKGLESSDAASSYYKTSSSAVIFMPSDNSPYGLQAVLDSVTAPSGTRAGQAPQLLATAEAYDAERSHRPAVVNWSPPIDSGLSSNGTASTPESQP